MKTPYATETQEELLKSSEGLVFYNPIAKHITSEQIGISKITLGDDFTKIDFVYISSHKYINGGWIQMDPNSFIRPIGSETSYPLIRAINIPLAPTKYHFQACGQVHEFSLVFAAVPKDVTHIDVIERLGDDTYFNFFKVALQHQVPTVIRIINEN